MRNASRNGFTITELIVAMGVFVIIVSIAVGVFVNAVRSQRRLTELMAVNNSAGSVLEQIAREVRTGYRFCESDTNPGMNPDEPCAVVAADSVSFVNYRGRKVTYALDGNGAATRLEEGNLDAPPLTASEVEVTHLQFSISQLDGNGDTADDACNPWRITIAMGVRSRSVELANEQEVRLQTTVSSRVFPVEAPAAPESIIEICQ
jgi:prepilin-type N-terminal cleavage/methylation domain-containing protein